MTRMRFRTVPACVLALLTLVACGGSPADSPEQSSDSQPATATPAAEPTEPPDPTAVPPSPTPEPYPGDGPWEVSFETGDGVLLSGMLYGKSEAFGVVLAPMYPGGQEGWTDFAATLAEEGYRALTFNLRGQGASEGEEDLSMAPADVLAAAAFLRDEQTERIMLMGADEGGTAAILAAAQDEGIEGLVVLSAPDAFEGLVIQPEDIQAVKQPSLWLGSRLDLAHAVESLYEQAGSDDKDLWIYEGSSLHGTYMFEGADGPDVRQRLLAFVEQIAGQ